MRKLALAGATLVGVALTLAAPAAAAAVAVPAAASAPSINNTCTTSTYTNTTTGFLNATTITPAGTFTNPAMAIDTKGVKAPTPVSSDKVTFQVNMTEYVKPGDITDMSYKTWKNTPAVPSVLPSYKLLLWVPGKPAAEGDANDPTVPANWTPGKWTTLVYTPINQVSPLPAGETTWDVDAAGAKFYSTQTIVFSGTKTWTEIKASYPNSIILWYEVGTGSGETGADTTFNNVKFAFQNGTAPACAAEHVWHQPDCTIVTHTTTADVTIIDDATATIPTDTLRLKVNTLPAATTWWVSTNVPAADITDLSYETFKHAVTPGGNAAALPAFRLKFDSNGDGTQDAILIYEPYFQISGNPATGTWVEWNVMAGNFWTSATLGTFIHNPGGGYNTVPGGADYSMNWTEIKAMFPSAKVLGYGLGLGTYNSVTDAEVRFARFGYTSAAAGGVCAKHVWAKPALTETAKTGFSATSWVVTGAGLVLAGTVLVLLFRRRRMA